ncbi:hypothetical protein EAO68_10780 [Streptomyces sp. wa22]|nr:hypothetical protein EAO68_10780 [Streptomyces sp. wa22]
MPARRPPGGRRLSRLAGRLPAQARRTGRADRPVAGRPAIAREEAGRLKVVQIDVDHNPDITSRYAVLSMPTLMVFQDGEPVKSMVGARPRRRLLQELEDWLPAAV